MRGSIHETIISRLLMILCAVSCALLGVLLPARTGTFQLAAAQSRVNAMSLTIRTLDPKTDLGLAGSCFIIKGVSYESCDDNGDGNVHFKDVVPGTYLVSQTVVGQGFERLADFSVTVVPEGPAYQWGFVSVVAAPAQQPIPLTIVTSNLTTGTAVPGVCLALLNGSAEVCDDDNDGRIEIPGVLPGTYLVNVTAAPSGYRLAYSSSGPIHVIPGARNEQELRFRTISGE